MSGPSHRFIRIRLPLRVGHVAAHGTESVRDVVLVEHRDGPTRRSGWGECPTLGTGGYVGGTTDEAWQAIVDLGAGRTPSDALPPMVQAARRDAALDAELIAEGRSLSEFLGGTPRGVPGCRVIAVEPHDRPAAIAAALDDAVTGRDAAAMIKVKVHGADLGGLADVRRQIGPNLALAADANGSIGALTAPIAAALVAIGLDYLEQPAPRGSQSEVSWDVEPPVPVALDESILSIEDLDAALTRGPYVISIKPARLGGVLAAGAAVRRARTAGARWFVGGMLETGIGRAAGLAVASMGGAEMLPTDLGPSSRYVASDVCEPHLLNADGHLQVPVGAGIGRRPDPDRLAVLTVDEIVIPL